MSKRFHKSPQKKPYISAKEHTISAKQSYISSRFGARLLAFAFLSLSFFLSFFNSISSSSIRTRALRALSLSCSLSRSSSRACSRICSRSSSKFSIRLRAEAISNDSCVYIEKKDDRRREREIARERTRQRDRKNERERARECAKSVRECETAREGKCAFAHKKEKRYDCTSENNINIQTHARHNNTDTFSNNPHFFLFIPVTCFFFNTNAS